MAFVITTDFKPPIDERTISVISIMLTKGIHLSEYPKIGNNAICTVAYKIVAIHRNLMNKKKNVLSMEWSSIYLTRSLSMAKMGLYTKFVTNGDCRAYYFKDGVWKRLGGNELNNVDHSLSENEVMNERIRLGIPFADLKTEVETMKDVHLPEWLI